MYRLVRNRKNDEQKTTEIYGSAYEQNDSVSLEKLRELLPQIKQLRNHDVTVDVTDSRELAVTIDGVKYETEA